MSKITQHFESSDEWTTVSKSKKVRNSSGYNRYPHRTYGKKLTSNDLFNEHTTCDDFKSILSNILITYTIDQTWDLLMKINKVEIGDSSKYKQWIYCSCSYSKCKKIHFNKHQDIPKKKAYIIFDELVKHGLFPWRRFIYDLIKLYIKFNKVIISMYKEISIEESNEKFRKNRFLTDFNISDLSVSELNKILVELSTDKKIYNIEWNKIKMLIQLYTSVANISRSNKYQHYRWPDIYLYHKNGIVDDMMYHWPVKLYDGFYCNKDRINHIDLLFNPNNNKRICYGSHNCSFGVHIDSIVLDISSKFRNSNKFPDSINIPKTHWINTIPPKEKIQIYKNLNNRQIKSPYYDELLNLISKFNVRNLYIVESDNKIKKYSDILKQIELEKKEKEKQLDIENKRIQKLIEDNLRIDIDRRKDSIKKQQERISKSKAICTIEDQIAEDLKKKKNVKSLKSGRK